MVINERIMKYLSAQEMNNILSTGLYDKYLKNKLARHDVSSNTSCQYEAKFDAFENHLAYNLLHSPNRLNPNLMLKYRDYLFNIFKQNPDVIFESKMFEKGLAELLFTEAQNNEIKKFKKTNIEESNIIYKKIKQGMHITETEKNILLKFLIKNIDSQNTNIINLLDDVYGIILSGKASSLLSKEFILKYTSVIARRDLHLPPVEIYIANTDINNAPLKLQELGASYGNNSVIELNKEVLADEEINEIQNIPKIIRFIQTICHEIKHSSQNYQASINEMSYASFECIRNDIFRNHLTNKNFNEYYTNYEHSEIERDANLYGWTMAERILKKYALNQKKSLEEIIKSGIEKTYDRSLANKSSQTKRQTKEYYNAKMMDSILSKHPELISQYSQLSYVYNTNGTRKSFIELIKENNSLEKGSNHDDISQVFYDYYVTDIKQGVLENTNIASFSQDEQTIFFTKIAEILCQELQLLIRSIKILTKKNENTFEHINQERVERIKTIQSYLENNKIFIDNLKSASISESLKTSLNSSMYFVERRLEEFQTFMKYYTNKVSDTNIYDEVISIPGGDHNGPKL